MAVDTNELDDLGSKQIDTFHCQLRANDEEKTVESIARRIDRGYTLVEWIQDIMSSMFPGLHNSSSYEQQSIEANLQFYVSSMILVAGVTVDTARESTDNYGSDIAELMTRVSY